VILGLNIVIFLTPPPASLGTDEALYSILTYVAASRDPRLHPARQSRNTPRINIVSDKSEADPQEDPPSTSAAAVRDGLQGARGGMTGADQEILLLRRDAGSRSARSWTSWNAIDRAAFRGDLSTVGR